MKFKNNPLDIPAEFVQPNYQNGSIANVPATTAALFDVPFEGLPPLPEVFWRPLFGGVKRVITLLIDGFGWNLLQKERPFLNPLLQQAQVVNQITSIFPSTTVAALSSLWTGVGPAQHSMVGLSLFFEEYGTIGQMLKFTPTFGSYPDALIEAGLEPENFLKWPGLAEQLAASGIPTHSFKGRDLVDTALSKMHGRGVTGEHGVLTHSHMFVQMRQLLEEKSGETMYISAYLPMVDMLSHGYGWNDENVAAELQSIITGLQTHFLEGLSAPARRGTVLLILADHGQIVTPVEEQITIEDHPELQKMLFMKPAGEPRVLYLYTKHGRQQEAMDYINQQLGHAMIAWPAAQALEAGIFGPAPHAESAIDRIGDVVVAMREGYSLFGSRVNEHENLSWMRGRHGGMSAAEMIVPWVGFPAGFIKPLICLLGTDIYGSIV